MAQMVLLKENSTDITLNKIEDAQQKLMNHRLTIKKVKKVNGSPTTSTKHSGRKHVVLSDMTMCDKTKDPKVMNNIYRDHEYRQYRMAEEGKQGGKLVEDYGEQ